MTISVLFVFTKLEKHPLPATHSIASSSGDSTGAGDSSLQSLSSFKSLSYSLRHKVWGGSYPGFAQGLRLAAVDWEDDGDLDCLCGTAEGKLMLLRDPKVGRPTGLAALTGQDNVVLAWDPNAQSRIRGYKVYRSEADADVYMSLVSPYVPLPTYRDFPPTIQAYDYKVSSVSRFYTAGNSTPTETESIATEPVRAELGTVRFFWNDAACKVGERVEVMLSIENSLNYDAVGKSQTITFDPEYLSFMKTAKSGLSENLTLTESCESGQLTVTVVGGALAAGSGKFLSFVFEAKKAGTTKVGEATVVIEPGSDDPTEVPRYSLGDLDGDGRLTELDVRVFIKVNKAISSFGRKPTENQIRAGDFNGDKAISGPDVAPFVELMKSKGIKVKLSDYIAMR